MGHGNGSYAYFASALKYMFRDSLKFVVVRDCVNPEARISFEAGMITFRSELERQNLPVPLVFSDHLARSMNVDIDEVATADASDVKNWVQIAAERLSSSSARAV